jgi:predicted metal-dependent hydrolase
MPRYNRGGKEYKKIVRITRVLVEERLRYFNKIYGAKIGRVSIRKQRTKWGSASSLGNLNFNYRIAFLPEELRDYIIVHELCHLLEPNHSRAFWAHVARVFPSHRALRKELRRYRF